MKRAVAPTILILSFFLAVRFHASATTCVAAKALTVKEVCGKVTNAFNEPIAHAEIDLLSSGSSEVSNHVLTDDHGDFAMPNVPSGEYEMQVKSKGYVTAAQQLIVTKNPRNNRCHQPVQVHLHPGSMGCSTITK